MSNTEFTDLDPYDFAEPGDEFVLPDDPEAEQEFWDDWREWQADHPEAFQKNLNHRGVGTEDLDGLNIERFSSEED